MHKENLIIVTLALAGVIAAVPLDLGEAGNTISINSDDSSGAGQRNCTFTPGLEYELCRPVVEHTTDISRIPRLLANVTDCEYDECVANRLNITEGGCKVILSRPNLSSEFVYYTEPVQDIEDVDANGALSFIVWKKTKETIGFGCKSVVYK
ncbi:uncharacterized protein LOC121431132 [Lytechinus variegatus]|uniref:uncharacterized protein LOC121431132 n=1 Tax=Lytechinus variegatus TaxID=7654 RepID=UPI001BB1436B|nr:uncharacterized protein LOC121431132 [Lytechinus variegatus]